MTRIDTATGQTSFVSPRSTRFAPPKLNGNHYRVDRVGPFHEVRRECWRGGKMVETQFIAALKSESEAEGLARKLQQQGESE